MNAKNRQLWTTAGRRAIRRPRAVAFACALLVAGVGSQAQLPTGGTVTAGQAQISQTATSQTVLQTTNKAVIDWKGFSVGAGNSVVFVQPSASSVTLNRVVGTESSSILGSLTANGQVFLVNPNGIFFGVNSVLDAAGMVVSTLDIRNDDFLAGRYFFSNAALSQQGAGIVNAGSLRARDGGYVFIVGDTITNQSTGSISAPGGEVGLASASQVTLDLQGDRLLNFSVDRGTANQIVGVDNLGVVSADGGRVWISATAARNVAGAVINNSGVIRAAGVEEREGEILLTASGGDVRLDGSLNVSGVRGGSVSVIANNIDLGATAAVNADALTVGNGGRIVLMAEDRTTSSGRLSAKGGALSGDGGFVETSAKNFLDVAGTRVDTSAAQGSFGQWLLDPTNITIQHGLVTAATFPGGALNNGGGANSIISDADINANLVTTNVTISTASAGASAGSIVLNGTADSGGAVNIVGSNGRDLSLIANAGISLNSGAIVNLGSTTSGGNLLLQAGGGVTQSAGSQILAHGLRAQGTGAFDMGKANDIRQNKVGVVAANVTGAFSFSSVNADPGSVLQIGSVGAVSGITTAGADIAIYNDSTGGLSVDAAVTTGSASAAKVTLQASEVATTGTQTLTLNANVTAGLVKLQAADDVLQSGGIIKANNLVVQYAEGANPDGVTLGQANVVGTLAAKVLGSGVGASNVFVFKNAPNTGLTIGSVDGVVGISSKGGNVTLTTDALDVAQVLDARGASTASVFIAPSSTNTSIKLGSEASGSLSLSTTELNQIKLGATGLLRIGSTTNTGGIDLTASLAPTADLTTLSLKTGGAITQTGGTSLSFSTLAIESGAGAVNITNNSATPGLISAKTQGTFRYNFGAGIGADLSVDTLDGVTGISSGGNAIAVLSSGALVLNKPVNASVSAPISFSAAGAGFSQKSGAAITASELRLIGSGTFILADPLNNVQTIAAALTGNLEVSSAVPLTVGTVTVSGSTTAGITTSGGNVKLASDQLTITSPITTAGGTATLRALSNATATELGTATKGTAGKLELSALEVGRINTGTGGLTIGDATIDGALSVVGAFNLAGTGPLNLINGTGGISIKQKMTYGGTVALTTSGSVGDVVGASGITAPSLIVSSASGVVLKGSGNSVASLTVENAASGAVSIANTANALSILSMSQTGGGDVNISNTGTLELTAAPIAAVGSNLSLSSGGAMKLLKGIDVGSTKNVLLSAASGGVLQSGGNIVAGGLELKGVGSFDLTNVESKSANNSTSYSYNDVATIAADVTGNLSYQEKDGLTVGTVGATTGINTHGGSLTLESGGPQQTGAVVMSPFGGQMTLAADLKAGSGLITLTANNSGAGGIVQTAGGVTAASLNVNSDGGVKLDQGGNHVDNIAVQAHGAVSIKDSGATTINGAGVISNGGAIAVTTGGLLSITQKVDAGSGSISLQGSAGIQQTAGAVGEPTQSSGGLRASNLLVQGMGPFNLTNGDNQVGTLAGSFQGDLYYLNAGALTIGSVSSINGVTSTNAGVIDIRTAAGSLIVNQGVYSAFSGARGDVSLVAGGVGSVLKLNANVRGASVRLNSEGTISQSGGSYIDATSLSLGAQNNALAAVPNRSNSPIEELILYFDGATTSEEDYFLVAGPSINKLVLYGQSPSSSFQLGAGKRILATNLLLTGFGSYNLTNAGNDIETLAVLRPWGSSSAQNVSYADVNGFDVGKIVWNSTLSYKTAAGVTWTWTGPKAAEGIQNNGAWPQLGFGGGGGDIRLTAGGAGAITLGRSIVTGGLVAITANGGLSEDSGAGIKAGKLKLVGQGAFKLDGPNAVGEIAANIANSGGITFVSSGNLSIATVDGLSGMQVSGPGATNISVRSTNGDLSVKQEVRSIADLGASVKTSAATVSLRAFDDLNLAANVNAQGGATSTGDAAVIKLDADVGGVFQTAGNITATDLGGATPTTQNSHRSLVQIRAAGKSLDAGTTINVPGLCGAFNPDDAGCKAGQVSLNNVSASSGAGSAAIDVFGPGGVVVSGSLLATGQTAPRINITGDIQDSDKKLKSSANITINGTVTVTQPGGSDVNKRADSETAGLLISGKNIVNTRVLNTNGDYGISMFAQGNLDIRADITTTSIAGVALSTGATFGRVSSSNSARVNAKQLALVGGKDKGIFDLTTNVENLQVLGARSMVVDNSAFSGELLAVLGRVSEATTDPLSGTAIPATNSPVGAMFLKTGGRVVLLSLNNQSSSPYDLNGNGISGRRPLTLIADALVETPGTIKVDPNTEVTLRPYTATRPIVVRNLPEAVPDPNSTYYLAGFVGVLAQLDGNVRLVIGGDDYTGNITVGSKIAGSLFPTSEQFSLGSMDILFSTKGRVYNNFNANPDYPSNWNTGALIFPPYSPTPDVFCAIGSACLGKITKGKVYIKDSLSNGATERSIVFQGSGDGTGATSIPPTGGGNNNNGSDDGSSSSPSTGDSGSSGSSDAPSDGAPTGGGNSGSPEDVAKTEVGKTNLNPSVVVTPPGPPEGDAGDETTQLDDLIGDLAPDGGNSGSNGGAQFSGLHDGAEVDDQDFNPLLVVDRIDPLDPVISSNPPNGPKSDVGPNDDSIVQSGPPKDGIDTDVPDLIAGPDNDTQNESLFSGSMPSDNSSKDFVNKDGLPNGPNGPNGPGVDGELNDGAISGGGDTDTAFGVNSSLVGASDGSDGSTGSSGGNSTGVISKDGDATDPAAGAGSGFGGGTGGDGSGNTGSAKGSLIESNDGAFGSGSGIGAGTGNNDGVTDLGGGGLNAGIGGSGSGLSGSSSGDASNSGGLNGSSSRNSLADGSSSGSNDGAFGSGSGFGDGTGNNDGVTGLSGGGLNAGNGGSGSGLSGASSGDAGDSGGTSADGSNGADLGSPVDGSNSSISGEASADGLASAEGGASMSRAGVSSGEDTGISGADNGLAVSLLGGADIDSLLSGVGGGALSSDGRSGGGLGGDGIGSSDALNASAGDAGSGANGSGLSSQSRSGSRNDADVKNTNGSAGDSGIVDSRSGGQGSGLSSGGSATSDTGPGNESKASTGGGSSLGGDNSSTSADKGDDSSASGLAAARKREGSIDDAFACVADRNQDTKALRAKAGQAIVSVKGAGVRLARGSCGDAGAQKTAN